ncbi:MAG: hypothetical protein H0X39_18920 [Actinobacteria bacterium]|nr:hypothetical protein [Actinomycetota bacterium]
MSRFSPTIAFLAVTALLLVYGRYSLSWVAGPVAALAFWALERRSREPGAPAPARTTVSRTPAPVD